MQCFHVFLLPAADPHRRDVIWLLVIHCTFRNDSFTRMSLQWAKATLLDTYVGNVTLHDAKQVIAIHGC